MTLLWFGIILGGLAALLWLLDWIFDRGEVDPQPYIEDLPVNTIHVTLHSVDVAAIERERILDAMGIAPQHREKPSELSGIRAAAAMQPSSYEAFLSENGLEEEPPMERDRR